MTSRPGGFSVDENFVFTVPLNSIIDIDQCLKYSLMALFNSSNFPQ